MKITVANKIYIEDPDGAIISYCKDRLVVDNPEFFRLEKLGKWTGNVPRQFKLYEVINDRMALPFGTLADIWRIAGGYADFTVDIRPIRPVYYGSCINLYDYQLEAVTAALRAKNGILVMPCGAGKTQTALEIISMIGGRCLWLTHTRALLSQSMNRAKSFFKMPDGAYGRITGGAVDIRDITFATVQTMARMDLSEYRNTWDVIIVDECHKAVGSPTRMMQFYKVISALSCRYKIGLTATPDRSDGMVASMYSLLGGVIYEVSREQVKDTTCPIKVRIVQTKYSPDTLKITNSDGTLNYNALVNDLTDDEPRRLDVLRELLDLQGPVMVLGNRVEYLNDLCRQYKILCGDAVCLSGLGATKKAREERDAALANLNSGKIRAIFATYQLAKEGLDVPNLRYLVLATPEKDKTTVTQAIGRVGRKAPGKEFGTVIDFVDGRFGLFSGWAKKRLGFYRKLECDILPFM